MLQIIFTYLKIIKETCPKIFLFFIILSPIIAVTQTLGIISIYPIITLITSPDVIIENKYFLKFYPFEFKNTKELIIVLAKIFLIINFLSLILLYLSVILTHYIAGKSSLNLKNKLYSKIVYNKNYLNTVSNKSNLISVLENELNKVTAVIESLLTIFQSITLFLMFLISIILIEPLILFAITLIVFSYFLLFKIIRKKLAKISIDEVTIGKKSIQHTIYINLGLKDLLALKLGKKISYRLKLFRQQLLKLNIHKISLITFPRYFFEIILYIAVTIFVIYFLDSKMINNHLGEIALLFVFLWKSIPLFFHFFKQASLLSINKESYNKIIKNINILAKTKASKSRIIKTFNRKISYKNIAFKYNENKNFQFNFTINKGQKILLSGPSGSGKSTLLNILTGLITDFNGTIKIDENIFTNKNYNTNLFGYIIQQPFLFSGTIYENITFKKSNQNSKLDKKFKKIFAICGLNNFGVSYDDIFSKKIELDSPDISGGQKQRISIARVLYSEPKIIIFDEATNSLDLKSETELFKNIFKYYPKQTIIVVTHRKINLKFDKKLNIIKRSQNLHILY